MRQENLELTFILFSFFSPSLEECERLGSSRSAIQLRACGRDLGGGVLHAPLENRGAGDEKDEAGYNGCHTHPHFFMKTVHHPVESILYIPSVGIQCKNGTLEIVTTQEESNETRAYHALAITTRGDYHALAKLRQTKGNWRNAWDSLTASTGREHEEEEGWRKLAALGITLVLSDNPAFPPLLREIPWPPHAIYVRGTLPSPDMPAVALVGTRKASTAGKATAKTFAKELSAAGIVIVSGLALGIDAAAHEGALEGGGLTIAVLAHGLDSIYPRTNERLAKRILEYGGALVSEYPLNTPIYPSRFLERNRIISGLSRGVLIVEAPERSGSLATARFALEQNRYVFVCPGGVRDPRYVGSHRLIREGAELVTEPSHILETLGIATAEAARGATETRLDTKEERTIASALREAGQPLDVDTLVALTALEARVINQTLSMLLIKNVVREEGGGYVLA